MIRDRVKKLRKLMKKNDIRAYLVPGTDPHQSEYVPELWQRRQWLSGFSGSAGDLAFTNEKAGLWTDSRYYLQAEEQLKDSGIDLYKIGIPETPAIHEWLKDQLKSGEAVGFDPRLFSCNAARKMEKYFKSWDIKLKAVEKNLVDEIWDDQPDIPSTAISVHPDKYSGESVESKLERLRQKLASENTKAHVLTTLDNIAWLFNIRGSDVEFNPVVIAYAIVTAKKALLFTHSGKVTSKLKKHLKKLAEIRDYDDFEKALKKLSKSKAKVWLDPDTVSRWIVDILKPRCQLFFQSSPVTYMKAVKNDIEVAGFKASHVRDGVAMVKFLHWLEDTVGKFKVSEISAQEKLEEFRKEQDLYQGPSFATISSYGEHGAIVHYSSSPETDMELKSNGIYLIDSGGQYLDGTTDITRTIALGNPTPEQRDRFTRVLKGHILLATTRFPRNTAGNQLDTIARKPLWDIDLNYGHGTGHGIGSYLNVHEGPQGISYYRGIGVKLEPGMVISNEPGFYKEGEYGLRVENLILTVRDEKSNSKAEFYYFETFTLCPVDLKLVEKSILSENEIDWLNKYHNEVRVKLSPHLEGDVLEWLNEATQPI